MGFVVDGFELRRGELSVSLRGGEALVTEQLLDRTKIRAFFKQVRSECMAQGVRMDVGGETPQDGDAFYDASHASRCESRLGAVLA